MKYKDQCPDFDTLSSWYDGLEDADIKNHVETCSDCQKVVAEFGIIQTATKISVPVPKDLNKMILEKCKERQAEEVEGSSWSLVLKIVVAIIIVLIIALLVY